MEATDNIKLKSLAPYRHYFPLPKGIDHIVKRGASVSDTVLFMPQAAKLSQWMVRDYVNAELKGLSLYGACRKLWHFVKEHIAYEKDDVKYKRGKDIRENFEQVRSPRRLIADGKGDCDCMTNFVNACMLEFGVKKGIINRITAYDYNDFFQHIYSLIPDGHGKYIIMDCVWNEFNKEKKYTNKEDHVMELQFLDGISSTDDVEGIQNKYSNLDAQDVFGNHEDFGELGKLFRKKTPEQKQAAKAKRQKFLQKGRGFLNKINKVNPATALLRAGLLASMKLNVMKVAEAIKWGYASREYAQEKGMDMSKYDRIKKILEKTQNIFYAAGGKPENLRKAILTGRGNRKHEVSGFDGLSANMPLSQLLGTIYEDELVHGMDGFEGFGSLEGGEGLGEPATGAAIATASTAMGALAALIKSIGALFPNKNKASKKGEESGESSSDTSSNNEEQQQEEALPEENTENNNSSSENTNDDNLPAEANDNNEVAPPVENSDPPEQSDDSTNGLAGIGTGIKTFYLANKKWINPVAITLGVGTLVYLIYKGTQPSNDKKENNTEPSSSIEGVKSRRPKRKRKHQSNHQHSQNSIIKLM